MLKVWRKFPILNPNEAAGNQLHKTMIAKERMYLNADKSEIVAEDSEDAAFLLAGKDCEIPEWAVKQFNLEENSDEEAKSAAPSENKMAVPNSNKKVGKK